MSVRRKVTSGKERSGGGLHVLRRCLDDIAFLYEFRQVRLAAGLAIDFIQECLKARGLVAELIEIGVLQQTDLTRILFTDFSIEFDLQEARDKLLQEMKERFDRLEGGRDIERRIMVGQLARVAVIATEVAYWDKTLPALLEYGPKAMGSEPGAARKTLKVEVKSEDYLLKRHTLRQEILDSERAKTDAEARMSEARLVLKRLKRREQTARRAEKRKVSRSRGGRAELQEVDGEVV